MPNPTPADRPADLLRAAARKLRALCLAVGDPDHPGLPWHTEQCGHKDRGECACIVAQGRTAEGRGPVTALHYIADTEHPDLAAFIALMHPGVGLALAAWLEREAEIWQVIDDASAHPEETGLKVTVGASTHAEALAVARQLLGTTEGAGAVAEPSVDRRARYEEALWVHALKVDAAATAVMAVADAEVVQAMRAMHDTKEEEREAHRLALSEALGLGTGAPWDAIRERAAELAVAPPAPADRAAILREAADALDASETLRDLTDDHMHDVNAAANELRRLAADAAAGVQPPTTSEADASEEQQAAVVRAIRDFQFDNYGLDDVDPNSEYAEWVGDLASNIVGALPAAPAAPEEPQ